MDLRNQFEKDGYVRVKGFLSEEEIRPFYEEITAIGRRLVGPDFDFWKGSALFTPENQSLLYDALRYLPALYLTSSNPRLLELCRSVGIEFPAVMGSCNMRLDRPGDGTHLFKWHQDTLYLLGSSNAVTIWIPLGRVDAHYGTIAVIPGSHTNGVYPFKKISDKEVFAHVPLFQRDLALDVTVDERSEVVLEAAPGDIVIFRQMLLHRSLPNVSDSIRWTCQVRIADLFEEAFIEDHFPMGERTNIYYSRYVSNPRKSGVHE
jgi:hypothetical protein